MHIQALTLGFLFLSILTKGSCGYRFLGLFPVPIKSHSIVFEKLMKVLRERGHEVDVLSYFPQSKPLPRYNDISMADTLPSLENNVSVQDAASMGMWGAALHMFKAYGTEVCEKVFKHPATEKLKSTRVKYDAIITEVFATDCLLGFGHLFQVPVIGISSMVQLPWGNDRMGNPDNPSYMPNYFVPRRGKMMLLHRLEIVIATLFSNIGYYLFSTIPSEMRARDFFGSSLPPLDVLACNTSLLLVNSHFSIDDAKPSVPGLVEIGGFHIESPKALPPNLATTVQSAAEGVIYFSMGTVLRADSFPPEKLQALLDAFAMLPQTVIWRGWNKNFSKVVPKNVVLMDWVPQLDILCHPKVRLFVTHGGHMSVMEALYCGLPILGIPLFAHQHLSVVNFETQGAGLLLEYEALSKDVVLELARELLSNDSYRTNARKLSQVFKDRPVAAADTAAYWIEYVVRHGGARHLRTKGADLIWYEYFLIDVLLAFMVVFLVFTAFFVVALNFLQNYFDSPPEPLEKEKQK